jgi:hypothetical protein
MTNKRAPIEEISEALIFVLSMTRALAVTTEQFLAQRITGMN